MERNQTELMTAVNQQHAWIQQLEQQIHVLEDRLSDLNDRIFD
jgi:TolA-binding protein